jgi:hypothetical protein
VSKKLFPFTPDGSLLHYPGYGNRTWHNGGFVDVIWKEDPPPFQATLVFDRAYSGRSARGFMFQDAATGATYPMMMRDVETLLKEFGLPKKGLLGDWSFVKRGQNYFITPEVIDP